MKGCHATHLVGLDLLLTGLEIGQLHVQASCFVANFLQLLSAHCLHGKKL